MAAIVVAELLGMLGVARCPHAELARWLGGHAPVLSSALLGSFLMFAFARPTRRALVVTTSAGLPLEAALLAWRLQHGATFTDVFVNLGGGLGIAAMVGVVVLPPAQGAYAWRSRLAAGGLLAALPGAVVLATTFGDLSVSLHPFSYDTRIYRADAAFGFQASWVLGRLASQGEAASALLHAVYIQFPAALSALAALAIRRTKTSPDDGELRRLLRVFVWAGLLAFACHQVLPAAGPKAYFAEFWPTFAPTVVTTVPSLALALQRSATPSISVLVALLLSWNARQYGRVPRVLANVWLGLTCLAALTLGGSYLVGLFIAAPLALTAQALGSHAGWSTPERRFALAVGLGGTAAWLTFVRYGIARIPLEVELVWALSLVTVPLSWICASRLAAAEPTTPPADHRPVPVPVHPRHHLVDAGVTAAFFLSGFAGLVYEVVFAKQLATTFGATASASATVLATYMGGMAIGAFLGGAITKSRLSPLRAYAIAEAGIALTCALSPWTFRLVRATYVTLATGHDPSSPTLTALQLALGSVAMLPPTILMGTTLPVLTSFLARSSERLGPSVATLYACNTFGAACGSLVTGYALLPTLGITKTTWTAVGMNLAVVLIAVPLASRSVRTPTPVIAEQNEVTGRHLEASRSVRRVGLAVLAVGGFVTLALETAYVHLLAVVVGSSTFAFSLMLFAFLLGLGGGSSLGRSLLRRNIAPRTLLGWLQAGLAASVLAGVFLWQELPDYFSTFEHFPVMRGFGEREFVRAVVCLLSLLPPATFIGASYPVAMEAVTGGAGARRDVVMGRAATLNTVGNIVGALAGGFFLVPHLGSLTTLHALAAATASLCAFALYPALKLRRGTALAPIGVVLVLACLQPRSFDWTRISGGGNVYFARQGFGPVIDHAESLAGGLTTVSMLPDETNKPVLTLLTNGKFQGTNNVSTEMPAQVGFSLVSLLHTPARQRALVIGVGTGVSASTMSDAGFARLDLADLSADVVRLARTHFANVNGGVLGRPNVHVFTADGRNLLLTRTDRYDLIGIELSSIWFAGAAALYNREFYELASSRLSERGVLQQWVQLHHLDQQDIASIIGTLRSVFERVWLYVAGGQGVLIACHHDCTPTADTLSAIDRTEGLTDELALTGGNAAHLRATTLLLAPPQVDRYLEDVKSSLGEAAPISTDDNLFLEYHTPRGNVRPALASARENRAILGRFASERER